MQYNAPWQLDRIDQATGTDSMYHYNDDGSGVLIYVIGHGVYRDHQEFAGSSGSRVIRGTKYATEIIVAPGDVGADYGYWPCGSPGAPSGTGNDGHETAVAAFAAGVNQGVAKNAKIVPIRIWNCNGYSSSERTNYAFDWIMDPNQNPYYNVRPAVVNYSGGQLTCNNPNASFLENEINKVVGHPYVSGVGCTTPQPWEWQGIPVVVSANNYNTDQIFTTPARMAFTNAYDPLTHTGFPTCGHVISVGATDRNDQRWRCDIDGPAGACVRLGGCTPTDTPGSNYGRSVDIYAPGANVIPAKQTGPTAYETEPFRLSGTSYAAPVVAGVIARMMQAEGAMDCDAAWTRLKATSSKVISFDQDAGANKGLVYRLP